MTASSFRTIDLTTQKTQSLLEGLKIQLSDYESESDILMCRIKKRASLLGAVLQDRTSSKATSHSLLLSDNLGLSVALCINNPLSHTEASLQAMSGLMAWHKHNSQQFVPLGLPYLTELTASLALTSSIANLIGQIKGNSLKRIDIFPERVALVAMAQYLAMELAGLKASTKKDNTDSPPFKSQDHILFEIEVLDPYQWGAFWQAFNLPSSDISASWQPYMQRYVSASAWLPTSLFNLLQQHDFQHIQTIAERVGISICALNSSDIQNHKNDIAPWAESGPWRYQTLNTLNESKPLNRLLETATQQPLTGITVVESTRLIQGPMATHILRMLGARVIKIEPVGGDPMRGMPPLIGDLSAHFHTINQGKEVVELDLHSPEGKADFRALIQSADVFFHNWGPGRAERLGLTQEKVNQIAPHLIYASASGSGNPPTPSAPIGTDFMMQAFSGVAANVSNPNKMGGALITMIDTLGAAAAAEGIVSALFRRFKDGSVNAIDSSMLGAASLLIDAKRTADAMHPPANQKVILDINQTLNLPNTFTTRDGTLFIETIRTPHQAEVLQGMLDRVQKTSPSAFFLHTLFTSHNTAFWEEQFTQQQIPSSQVNQNAQDILHHPVMKQHVSVNHDTLNFLSPWTYSKGEQ